MKVYCSFDGWTRKIMLQKPKNSRTDPPSPPAPINKLAEGPEHYAQYEQVLDSDRVGGPFPGEKDVQRLRRHDTTNPSPIPATPRNPPEPAAPACPPRTTRPSRGSNSGGEAAGAAEGVVASLVFKAAPRNGGQGQGGEEGRRGSEQISHAESLERRQSGKARRRDSGAAAGAMQGPRDHAQGIAEEEHDGGSGGVGAASTALVPQLSRAMTVEKVPGVHVHRTAPLMAVTKRAPSPTPAPHPTRRPPLDPRAPGTKPYQEVVPGVKVHRASRSLIPRKEEQEGYVGAQLVCKDRKIDAVVSDNFVHSSNANTERPERTRWRKKTQNGPAIVYAA